MPTVMTLSEAEFSVPTYVPDDSYGLLGDGAIITWLKDRGPVLGGAIVLGMSVVTGLVVGSVAVKVFGDKSGDRPTSFAGARRRRGLGNADARVAIKFARAGKCVPALKHLVDSGPRDYPDARDQVAHDAARVIVERACIGKGRGRTGHRRYFW